MNRGLCRISGVATLCVLVLLSISCQKERTLSDSEMGDYLLNVINNSSLGIAIDAPEENIHIKKAEKDRRIITFIKPTVTVQSAFFTALNTSFQFKPTSIPVDVDEITFIYGHKEKYLVAVSLKNPHFYMEDLERKEEKSQEKITVKHSKSEFSMDLVRFDNYNISALLQDKRNARKDAMEILMQFAMASKSVETVFENAVYKHHVYGNKGYYCPLRISFDKIITRNRQESGAIFSIYKKKRQSLDMSSELAAGKSVIDLDMKCSGVTITVNKAPNTSDSAKKNKNEGLYSGFLEKVELSYALKPDKEKAFYKYEFVLDIANTSAKIPGEKYSHLIPLFSLEKANIRLSLKKISAPAVAAYLELTRNQFLIGTMEDEEQVKQLKLMNNMKSMTLASEFLRPKPILTFSIAPFKHRLLDFTANGTIHFTGMNLPTGNAKLKIKDVKEVKERLKALKIFSPAMTATILQNIEQNIMVSDDGSGSLQLETRKDQPGIVYINNRKVEIR